MLEQLLKYLKNWFRVRDDVDGKHPDTYVIESGSVALPFLVPGQYFRIVGSVLNNGLYKLGEGGKILDGDGKQAALKDETFTGSVWALAVPLAVVSLAQEIAKWQEKYGAAAASPYTSESFAGYSYSKSAGSSGSGVSSGWEAAFADRLHPWRKIREN